MVGSCLTTVDPGVDHITTGEERWALGAEVAKLRAEVRVSADRKAELKKLRANMVK